jgi:TatD DNase family protein
MYDTHTHLQETVYDSFRMAYLDDLYDSGVKEVMIASYDIPSSSKAFQIKTSYTGPLKLHIAAGIHPSYIEENPVDELEKYIIEADAVGETGLDFRTGMPDKEKQKASFEAQLKLCEKYKKPVLIHSVKACDETLKMLKAHPDVSGIMHGFSYSPEAAKQFINLDFRIGIGSMLLNPKARKIKEVVKVIPAEHLVIETDCPFGIEENSTALKHAEILKQITDKIENKLN